MKRINNIFYSLQGEGCHTGRAAVFVRFAGCNLRCPFCDTQFDDYCEMTDQAILQHVQSFGGQPLPMVVLTGGEPTLQADAPLIDLLHSHGYQVAMESNGTRQPPANLDWLTVSPKGPTAVTRCQELKVVFRTEADADTHGIQADHYLLQPCDTGDAAQNARITQACVDYIKHHPQWRLSLQTHKLIGIE